MSDFDPRWLGVSIEKEQWHFHSQLYDRYGVVLQPGEYSRIVKLITTGRAPIVERAGKGYIYAFKLSRTHDRFFVLARGGQLLTAWPPTKRVTKKWKATKEAMRAAGHYERNHFI